MLRLRAFVGASMCLAVTLLAMAARSWLHPLLGDALPFVFAFPAVVACALWGGLVAGLAATVVCAAWHLFTGAADGGAGAVLQASAFMAAGSVIAVLVATLSERRRLAREVASDDAHSHRDSVTLFWLRAGILLSVLVPWAVFVALALFTHASAVQAAERRMDRLAAIAHEHALKLFETSDLLIRQINQQTQAFDSDRLLADQDALSSQLSAMTQGMAQVHSVWILDQRGAGVVTSRVRHLEHPRDFSDRPVFLEHRAEPGRMRLTPPRLGQVTNEVFFDLSRVRVAANGRFNGVTMVGLYPSYFTTFYRDLADSENGVILSLIHSDGRMVARWPQPTDAVPRLAQNSPLLAQMRESVARGRASGTSTFGGVTRFGSFRQVGSYPAYVYAGTDEASALAGWRHDLLVLAAFILPLSLALALISWHALRRTERHIEAARQLRTEAVEREKVEAALRQSQKLEAMGHLTGGVAHDFNNLLMVVNLNVTLLRQRLRDGVHDRQIDAIERSVAAGKKLTRQLLAFSRRQPLLPQVIDLEVQMPALLDLIRPALGGRVDLTGSVAPGTRAVRLDSAELELALINLAVNARDAMPEGGHVRVHARDVDGFVELAFTDTGAGIDPKDLERVFEPFFTTKALGHGTGLGLAQVYGLCARAGGSARVDSTLGHGTTVLLRFPGVQAASDDVPQAQAPTARIEQLGLRVLLVEDNTDIASATREILEAAGCEVVHVPQATLVANALAEGPRVNIVLSDIVMPGGMDGLQLCEQLSLTHERLPVVLMTGYAEKLGEAEALGLVVLPKPFDPALLLRTLREQMQAGEQRGIARLQD